MEVSGQFQALAVLLLGKVPPVPTEEEDEWATDSLDVMDKIKLSYSHQESTPSMCKPSNTIPEHCLSDSTGQVPYQDVMHVACPEPYCYGITYFAFILLIND